MELTKSLTCQKCGKPNCKQIEFNKITHEWLCFECAEKLLKEEEKIKNEKR